MKEKTLYERSVEELLELSQEISFNGLTPKFDEYKEFIKQIVSENEFLEVTDDKEDIFKVTVRVREVVWGHFAMTTSSFSEYLMIELSAGRYKKVHETLRGEYEEGVFLLQFKPLHKEIIKKEVKGNMKGFEEIFGVLLQKVSEMIRKGYTNV